MYSNCPIRCFSAKDNVYIQGKRWQKRCPRGHTTPGKTHPQRSTCDRLHCQVQVQTQGGILPGSPLVLTSHTSIHWKRLLTCQVTPGNLSQYKYNIRCYGGNYWFSTQILLLCSIKETLRLEGEQKRQTVGASPGLPWRLKELSLDHGT